MSLKKKRKRRKAYPKKAGIYLLTNKINGKIYVGKAKNLRNRLRDHKTVQNRIPNKTCPIEKALHKYGWKNFQVEFINIFDEIDDLDLLYYESHWINQLDCLNPDVGYNVVDFGSGCIKRWMEKIKDENPDYWKNKGLEIRKPIKQIDKNTGDVIRIWDSPSTASKELNISYSRIYSVCQKNKSSYSAGGFKWEYVNEQYKEREESRKMVEEQRIKRINQINISDGQIIKTWESAPNAASALGLNNTKGILGVCYGRCKTAHGYKWEFGKIKNDDLEKIKLIEESKPLLKKEGKIFIRQIEPSTQQVVKVWTSIREVSRNFGVGRFKITKACHTGKIVKGFMWKYEEEDLMDNDTFGEKPRKKIANNHKKIPVKQIDYLNGEIVQIWESGSEAARHLGVSSAAIYQSIKLNGKCKLCKWEYTTKEEFLNFRKNSQK